MRLQLVKPRAWVSAGSYLAGRLAHQHAECLPGDEPIEAADALLVEKLLSSAVWCNPWNSHAGLPACPVSTWKAAAYLIVDEHSS